jgi:hypothetical protein
MSLPHRLSRRPGLPSGQRVAIVSHRWRTAPRTAQKNARTAPAADALWGGRLAVVLRPGSFEPWLWWLKMKQTAAKIERLVGDPFGSVMPALIAAGL